MAVRIIADSIIAPPLDQADRWNVTVIPIHIHYGETVLLDLVDIDPERFYRELPNLDELPTTSAPGRDRFASVFRDTLAAGDDVLCLTVSAGMSNTYQRAIQAAGDLANGSDRIRVLDTESAGAAGVLLVLEAARQAQTGDPLPVIAEWIGSLVPQAKLVAMLDTLIYIEKSGRVGKAAAVAGDLFRIKPLIFLHRGRPQFFGRARGKNQAFRMIVEEFDRDTRDSPHLRVLVTHSNAPIDAEILAREIGRIRPGIRPESVPLTPAMGAHAGPGVVGVGYLHWGDNAPTPD